jgi:hypothetical protein
VNNRSQWQGMIDQFREEQVKYNKLKKIFLDELNSADLRISRRSERRKQSLPKRKQKFTGDHINYDKNQTKKSYIFSNSTTAIDRYEYEDLDSEDGTDNFKLLEDIRGICDQMEWNVINTTSTIYILTIFSKSDQIICSLRNVERDIKYRYVCEYG